jgi:hypothetical protein
VSDPEQIRVLDKLKWSLRRLQIHNEVLRLGLPLMLLGSLAAPDFTPGARRVTALKAIARIYRLGAQEDLTDTKYILMDISRADRIFGGEPSYLKYLDVRDGPGPKTGDPSKDVASFAEWATMMKESVASFDAATLDRTVVDRAYWDQWKIAGNELERISPAGQPGEIDILHAAAHGGIPVVPPRGGMLSVCELSRLWFASNSFSKQSAQPEENSFKAFALRLLVGGPVSGKPGEARTVLEIMPLSVDSPSWSWRPEPGVSACALLPPDAKHGLGSSETTWEELFALVRRAAANVDVPQAKRNQIRELYACEIDGQRQASGFIGLRSVTFGFGDKPKDTGHYYARPTSIAELLVAVKRRELINAPPSGLRGVLVRLYRSIRHPLIVGRSLWRRLKQRLSWSSFRG